MIKISGVKFSAGRVEFDVVTQATAVESFDFLLGFDPEEVDLAAVTVTGPSGWSVIPNSGGPGELLIGGFSSNFTPVAAGGLLLKVSLGLKVASDTNVAMTLEGSFNDPAVTVYPETVTLASSPATELDVQVLSWKNSEPLPGTLVEVQGGPSATTASDGHATLPVSTLGSINLQVSRSVEPAEAPATSAAVTLQDAVSILKMIAGQSLNGEGVAAPRSQSLAADFDGSGSVSLADAIGVLRHAVGLPAAAPAWVFIEAGGGTGQSVLNPGIPDPIAVEATSVGTIEVNLIGVLRGDVDGSFAPATYGVYPD